MKRYRLKKKFIVLLVIIIIGIIISIILLNKKDSKISINNNVNKELLRSIKIDTDESYENISDLIYKVEDNKIKYIVKNKNDITFYSYDMFNNKLKEVGKLNNYDYCYKFENDLICYNNSNGLEENGEYFSFDMKKIKKSHEIDINSNAIINTSKGIVKETGSELYLNDKKIIDTNDLGNLLEVFETNNNLFYIFSKEKAYTVLNNEDLKVTEMPYTSYYKYNDGYIFRKGKEYSIFNLKNNSVEKYNYDSVQGNGEYYTNLVYKNELIVIDSIDSKFIFEQPKTGNIFIYDNDINKISNAMVYDNYLIFFGIDKTPNLFILDLNLLKRDYITYEDYINKLLEENNKIIKDVKDNYNVNILVRDDYKNDFGDFTFKYLSDEDSIKRNLNIIEKTLSEYKKETFDYFVHDGYTGLYIYVVGTITSSDGSEFAANGYTLEDEDKHLVVLDGHYINDNTLRHELMHCFDRTLIEKKEFRIDFTELNPPNFNYTLNYDVYGNDEYIKNGDEPSDNVYFYNGYSSTTRQEDVASTYEAVCSGYIDLSKYPKIEKKFNYIKENMIKHIPGISESSCFKN